MLEFIRFNFPKYLFMLNQDQIVGELKHLIRYFHQAAHEFFDEFSHELTERLETIYNCLEENKNTLKEYECMIGDLVSFQADLKRKAEDLGYLADHMKKLFQDS